MFKIRRKFIPAVSCLLYPLLSLPPPVLCAQLRRSPLESAPWCRQNSKQATFAPDFCALVIQPGANLGPVVKGPGVTRHRPRAGQWPGGRRTMQCAEQGTRRPSHRFAPLLFACVLRTCQQPRPVMDKSGGEGRAPSRRRPPSLETERCESPATARSFKTADHDLQLSKIIAYN